VISGENKPVPDLMFKAATCRTCRCIRHSDLFAGGGFAGVRRP